MTTTTSVAQEILETVPPIMRFIRTEMRAHGGTLSVPQFRTLAFVRRHPDCSLGDVADHLGITRATASAMMERLVQQKLVDRQTDPRERRRHQLTLTPAGLDLLDSARGATRDQVAGLLAGLRPDQLQTVHDAMALLSQAFREVPPHDRPNDQP